MNKIRKKPTVFVSSTCYDLKQVREDIKDFFENTYGFEAILSEFNSFPIDPAIGTCDNCLNNVDNYADLFILIIGNRYGYITDQGKSITNLEYLHAKAKGIPIFVFVDKQLYATWNVWKGNKGGDYSSLVDNPKMFDFISDIYEGAQQWVYTYDSVKDITMTMKNQLGLIFSDGLIFKKITTEPQYAVLNGMLPPKAARTLIEQPYAWEYKFLAYVLKGEFDNLRKSRWDFKYGFFEEQTYSKTPEELLLDISEKLEEIQKITEFINVLINHTMHDAIGAPGVPSDLEMIIYFSKQFSALYQRLVAWGLHFKSLHTDAIFDTLLALLYKLPSSILMQIDDFVNNLYQEIINIPDIDDHSKRLIHLECILDASNTEEINAEIENITRLLQLKL